MFVGWCWVAVGGWYKAGFMDEQVERKGNEEEQGEPWPGWFSRLSGIPCAKRSVV